MGTPTFLNRMKKELADLERDPPPLVTCYPFDDNITQLEAYLNGPPNTPYEKGIFRLDVNMPQTYPFDPPMIRFRTPIYHPNIDECGRICASILKKGKDDQWKPSMNLRTTLLSLHALIGNPNPDDPLDADIAREYQQDYDLFARKAMEHTLKHAVDKPDNLLPDPYAESSTHTTHTTSTDFDGADGDSSNILSTSRLEDVGPSTSSKSKSKLKLSLSRKKQSNSQSTTLPSLQSAANDVGSNATKEGRCDRKDHSTPNSYEFGSKDKATTIKNENERMVDSDDVLEQPNLSNLSKGGLTSTGSKHENDSKDEKWGAMEQPKLDDGLTKHDKGGQQGDTGYENHFDNQRNQTKNDKGDIGKQLVCIDLDNETHEQEQLLDAKTTYILSDETDDTEEQAIVDVENKSGTGQQGYSKVEMDEKCENAAVKYGLTSSPTSIDKTSETPSEAISISLTETAATAPLPLTPSSNKSPSPSSANVLDSNDHSTNITQPLSPLKTVTVDDTSSWTYTNHYSSHHLTFAADDPFTDIFPAFEEVDARLTTPKRKSKLSLSCKKKPKTE